MGIPDDNEALPLARSAASMEAFDQMPPEWRQFCADYPRTASGQQLAEVLAFCDGNIRLAKALLRELLPINH